MCGRRKEWRKDKADSVEEGEVCGQHVVNSVCPAVGIHFQSLDGKELWKRADGKERARVCVQ